MVLNDKQLDMCKSSTWDFSDLKALFLNCTFFMTWNLLHLARMIKDAGGNSGTRQPALEMGRRLSLRSSESFVPLDRASTIHCDSGSVFPRAGRWFL